MLYADYDIILDDIDEILTDEIQEQTKLNRIARIKAKIANEIYLQKGTRVKASNIAVDENLIDPTEFIYRVSTNNHIPKVENSKGLLVDIKVNFPPFKHYIIEDGNPVEVGRSHWDGDFKTGKFNIRHGRYTEKLGHMFLMLVKRYGQRGNWRGYCVDETTEALTQRGWLNINEINEKDIILSYDEGKLKWSKIKSIFRDDYDGNMFHLTVRGMDALVTPQHKFITDGGLKKVEYLLEKDKIILTGEPVENNIEVYSDAFVELVGWAITEGNYYQAKDRNYTRVTVYQNEGEYADRIRDCLNTLNIKHGETHKKNPNDKINIAFTLPKNICQQITNITNDKVLSMPFIMALTQKQKMLLINTMVDADGWRNKSLMRYCQKDKKHTDSFLVLCTMAGLRPTVRERNIISYGKPTNIFSINIFSNRSKSSRVENINFHGAKRSGVIKGLGKKAHPNEATIHYKGKVWCPETEYGSFMARRNGSIYLTGNTYNDEMQGQALLQLSNFGLKFNEAKSQNPFAYYTTVITNSFTRVLNSEKKGQSVKETIMMDNGLMPTFNQQASAEIQREKDRDN